MLDGLLGVVSLGVGLSEELIGLNLLLNVVGLLAELKELLSVLDRFVQLALSLVDHSDLLVALSLDNPVVGILGHVQTLVEELQRKFEFVLVKVLVGDELVDTDEVF